METGTISNEEAEALLSDAKIVTRKQSKADSVARKSNVNSDENVNQLAEVLKNQDTRGRQIACKTSKLSILRLKFQKNLHSWTQKSTKVQDSTKNLSLTCKHTTNLLRIFNTRISVGSNTSVEKKFITQSISEPQESRRLTHAQTLESSGFMYDKYFETSCTAGCK